MTDPLDVALIVIAALERAAVRYTVGGSVASSFSGEPRASLDVDIVVDLRVEDIDRLIDELGDEFYADSDAIARAVRTASNVNVIHQPSGIKVDLFVAGSPLEMRQLDRRIRVPLSVQGERFIYVHSPEDILLQKLHWYRLGGERSERQWRDVLSILVVQGDRLDEAYVTTMASQVGVADLLDRARREAGPRDSPSVGIGEPE